VPWRPPSAAGPGAGFTTGEPWLPLVGGAEALNAETQAADATSTLSLTRRLAALRRATPALQLGAQRPLSLGEDVLAWERTADGERLVAAVNFATAPVALAAAAADAMPARAALVVSTDPARAGGDVALAGLALAAGEGVILRL
jgi:alpha-glucosidase